MNNWDIPDWLEEEVKERDNACVYCGIQMIEMMPPSGSRKADCSSYFLLIILMTSPLGIIIDTFSLISQNKKNPLLPANNTKLS